MNTDTTTATRMADGSVIVKRGENQCSLTGAEARKPFVITWFDSRGFVASGCVSAAAARRAVRNDFLPTASDFAITEVA